MRDRYYDRDRYERDPRSGYDYERREYRDRDYAYDRDYERERQYDREPRRVKGIKDELITLMIQVVQRADEFNEEDVDALRREVSHVFHRLDRGRPQNVPIDEDLVHILRNLSSMR